MCKISVTCWTLVPQDGDPASHSHPHIPAPIMSEGANLGSTVNIQIHVHSEKM